MPRTELYVLLLVSVALSAASPDVPMIFPMKAPQVALRAGRLNGVLDRTLGVGSGHHRRAQRRMSSGITLVAGSRLVVLEP